MRKTKEVLRLRFELGLGLRQIARSCSPDLSQMGWRECGRFPRQGCCYAAVPKICSM